MRQKKETVLEKKASTLPEISLYCHTSALTSYHFTANTCLMSLLCHFYVIFYVFYVIFYVFYYNTLIVCALLIILLSFIVAVSIKMLWKKPSTYLTKVLVMQMLKKKAQSCNSSVLPMHL